MIQFAFDPPTIGSFRTESQISNIKWSRDFNVFEIRLWSISNNLKVDQKRFFRQIEVSDPSIRNEIKVDQMRNGMNMRQVTTFFKFWTGSIISPSVVPIMQFDTLAFLKLFDFKSSYHLILCHCGD